MSRFFSPALSDLAAYVPGEQPRGQAFIKLNTNESPFPPAPGVIAALNAAEVGRLNLYSDPTALALEEAIASFYGLSREQVISGNGSDEILAFAIQAFGNGGVCFPDITYGFYPVLARLYGIDAKTIPLSADFRIIPADYDGAGRTIFIANPNAPTGLCLTAFQVEHILKRNPDSLVMIDEAYVDFGGESSASLLACYENLLIVHTFSKSRNLAGGRIGFALGSPDLILDLRRIKFSFNPYSLNRLSILAGAAAMEDTGYFTKCTRAVTETRDWATEELKRRGFTLTDSKANFLFAKPPRMGGKTYMEALRERGVLIRHFNAPRIDAYVRITVGSREQMLALLEATDSLMEEITCSVPQT